MKSKITTLAIAGLLLLAAMALAPSQAFAQEGELQVVDEVIAQVNDDVITLSMLKRESKERIDTLKQSGMPEQQAIEEVNKRQAELIATLINEQLLLQKGKELDLAKDVEDEVNRRMFEVAKEQGIQTIEKLDEALKQNGQDPTVIRQTLRTEIMKQMVIQQEVDRKIFLGLTMDELKKYFDTHKDSFRKPESVKISDIYLNISGKSEADVKARALELVAQLRAGADFKAVAAANSEREQNGVRTAPQDKGEVGTFEVPALREDVAAAIKNVKVGGISDPMLATDGYHIFRVDERSPASDVITFNENKVREAMTIERSPKERDTYLQTLRNEGYVKVAENYRATVEPLLKLSAPAAAKSTEKNKKDEKNKKP
ncbi:MAG TPA: peptidyl-prolyl cis-trans isomerase [Pyrinomonadaceae bacterium]